MDGRWGREDKGSGGRGTSGNWDWYAKLEKIDLKYVKKIQIQNGLKPGEKKDKYQRLTGSLYKGFVTILLFFKDRYCFRAVCSVVESLGSHTRWGALRCVL